MRTKAMIAALLLPVGAMAQDPTSLAEQIAQETAALEAAAIHIDGRNPNTRPPLHMTMYWFLQTMPSHEDALTAIPRGDRDFLNTAAGMEETARQNDLSVYVSLLSGACAFVSDQPALAIAAALEGVANAFSEHQEQRYARILNALSGAGRSAVVQVLDTRVAPNVSHLEVDYTELARRAPDLLKRLVQSECDIYIKGLVAPGPTPVSPETTASGSNAFQLTP